MPISTMASRLSGRGVGSGVALSFISLEARAADSVSAAVFQVTNLLRRHHRILREDDLEVRSPKEALSLVGSISGSPTLPLAAIAAIALLVGGIGIMNIMLVSVSERTAEIGLRKAVGARNSDLLLQFRLAALLLACLGGLLGAAGGVAAERLIALLMPLPALVDGGTLLISLALSGGLGLVFAVLQAR